MNFGRANIRLIVTILSLFATAGLAHAESETPAASEPSVNHAPLQALGQVARVELVYKRVGKAALRRPAGVRVSFLPAPGMSAPWLLHTAQTQAKQATGEHPLAVPGLKLQATGRGAHFQLYIEAPTTGATREVLRRLTATQ